MNFFKGKCDAREAAMVQALLKENPDILKEYIEESAWENFQPAQDLSRDISGKLWKRINPRAHYSYFRWMAVAASVLLVIGLSWHFIFEKQKTGITGAAAVAKTRHIFNNTLQKMTLTLSDGSTVELSPNSTLSYPEGFSAAKREVILSGEANFSVAKDIARPFSVYSNAVLITVLGTRFTVKSYEANNATKVILHEGGVMVKTPNKKEYYLSPGDIFIFRKVSAHTKDIAARATVANDSLAARILHLEKDKDDCYVFNDYPLDVVFDQLQLIYNEKIIYNKADLGNRSFIGKIDKRDSLSHILKSIALLNNFGLHRQGDSVIISN